MSRPRHTIHSRGVAALGATLVLAASAFIPPAYAAPPDNDEPAQALTIPSVPATLEADTRQATSDTIARDCVFGRSVWFRYVPERTARVRISTIGSTFDPVLAVYIGSRAPRTRLACRDDSVGVQAAIGPRLLAGEHYWIAVSSCCGSRRSPGGDMMLHLSSGATPAGVAVDVTQATSGGVSGRLRVFGTVACDTPSLAAIRVRASQRSGGAVARGSKSRFLSLCTTEPVEWMTRIDSETGWAFNPGPVALDVRAIARDGFSGARLTFESNHEATDDPAGRAAR